MTSSAKPPLTGKRVFVYMLVFFGVITAVNAVFITKAIQSNSGIVNESPYERGLSYNKILEQHEKEKALGWKGVSSVENNESLVYVLTDMDSKPLSGAKVTVQMVRPLQSGHDYDLILGEESEGRYVAKLNAPLKGSWTAHILVMRGENSYNDIAPLVLQ